MMIMTSVLREDVYSHNIWVHSSWSERCFRQKL